MKQSKQSHRLSDFEFDELKAGAEGVLAYVQGRKPTLRRRSVPRRQKAAFARKGKALVFCSPPGGTLRLEKVSQLIDTCRGERQSVIAVGFSGKRKRLKSER